MNNEAENNVIKIYKNDVFTKHFLLFVLIASSIIFLLLLLLSLIHFVFLIFSFFPLFCLLITLLIFPTLFSETIIKTDSIVYKPGKRRKEKVYPGKPSFCR